MKVFVQFSDSSKEQVVAEFGGQQDREFYPHQGEIPVDDPRYVDFLALIAAVKANTPEANARAWRDAEIVRVAWLRDRHRDELELGEETTVTAEQYSELLTYIRNLREWPATVGFPVDDSRPLVPVWITELLQ
ncbi:tail fiber assembly protein [Pseudomonas fluorescens group sp. PF-1]